MKKIGHIAKHSIRGGGVALAIGAMLFAQSPQAYADWTPDDAQAIYNNWPGWVVDDNLTCSTTAPGDNGGVAGSNSGTWTSGEQPPYILETFMIEVLKDIAAKRGVDPQSLITEEHVTALVAFAIGEGGDITNHDIFNPLNTGINAPDLTVGGVHVTNGLQSFKSFDAGVEANARVMTGANQKRLSDVLIKPNSTAKDFMYALTYFDKYPGNKLWAEASTVNPDKYYAERLDLVARVRRDYVHTAGLIIGTPALEGKKPLQTAPEKLRFHVNDGDISAEDPAIGTVSNCDTPAAGAGTGKFKDVVRRYALPTYHHAPYVTPYAPPNQKMTLAYYNAVRAAQTRHDYVGGGKYPGVDCGGFVTLVFHDSGADPQYNQYHGNVKSQRRYLNDMVKTGKYKIVTDRSNLLAGDIYINADATHTFIAIGKDVFPGYDAASASFSDTGLSWRVPMASHTTDDGAGGNWYRPQFPIN